MNNKKIDLDSILNLGSDVLKNNTRNGSTLYNANLFADMNAKQKKSIRLKLRRRKDNFISTYIQFKHDKEKMLELKKVWFEYAKNVYVDVNKIIDNNSTEQNKNDALLFLEFINDVDKKEAPKQSKKK